MSKRVVGSASLDKIEELLRFQIDMSGADYGNYRDWKGWADRCFGQYDRTVERYFEAEMRLAELWPVSNRSLLEIGFGNGDFAQWSVGHGAAYRGTERIPELVSAGCATGLSVFSNECDLVETVGGSSVDAVVAFDVFEHLDLNELQELLDQLATCLKAGGLIVARVPSGDSPFARAIQHGDITHKSILGSSAVHQIATRCGFEVLQVREPAFPVSGLGVRSGMRRRLVRLARSLSFAVLRSVFLGNMAAVLTPNMVFILRKPG